MEKKLVKTSTYSQKPFDHAKQSATDNLKLLKKKVIKKTAKTTGDLNGNKIANKITIHNRTIKRQLQTRMIKKYLKK